MKRSEAVGQMAGYLSGYHWYAEKHPSELLELAQHVITALEKFDFAPPGYMKPIQGAPLIPGDFKNEEGVWCTPGVREWEPE